MHVLFCLYIHANVVIWILWNHMSGPSCGSCTHHTVLHLCLVTSSQFDPKNWAQCVKIYTNTCQEVPLFPNQILARTRLHDLSSQLGQSPPVLLPGNSPGNVFVFSNLPINAHFPQHPSLVLTPSTSFWIWPPSWNLEITPLFSSVPSEKKLYSSF